jgi:5-methylcytosine-specific restriction enzyme A
MADPGLDCADTLFRPLEGTVVALLYYWRPDNYARDWSFGFGYHLNQNSPAMVRALPGDSLWAFTRRRPDGLYVLAAELVIRAVTRNPANYRYGVYRVWGDLERSRYFDVERGPSAEPLIRALEVRAGGPRLGQAFQGRAAVRVLTDADARVLEAFAADLQALERVGIFPEDEFEARLVHGEVVQPRVLREAAAGYDTRRLEYLYASVDVQRARRNVERLHDLYGGRCQLCLFDPQDHYGHRLCHGHHVEWLSRGGADELENMVLLCPNHHAAVHRDDAPFDYGDAAFRFSVGRTEPLLLNVHLTAG